MLMEDDPKQSGEGCFFWDRSGVTSRLLVIQTQRYGAQRRLIPALSSCFAEDFKNPDQTFAARVQKWRQILEQSGCSAAIFLQEEHRYILMRAGEACICLTAEKSNIKTWYSGMAQQAEFSFGEIQKIKEVRMQSFQESPDTPSFWIPLEADWETSWNSACIRLVYR